MSPTATVTGALLICDDHRLFADSLAMALGGRGFEIAGTTYTSADALRVLGERPVDAGIVDKCFPGADGLDLVRTIVKTWPRTRVLVLSGLSEPDLQARTLEAGASGFAGKDVGIDRLASIIGRILRGETVSSPSRAWYDRDPRAGELKRLMTARERAVLERLVQGKETAAIASDLGISYTTTRTHIQNLLTKLGVHSKLELVAMAITYHLVAPPRRAPVR